MTLALALPIIYRYTDLWCNTTVAAAEGGRGPHSCRALLLRMDVEMEDGSTFVVQTKAGAGAGAGAGGQGWVGRQGPILWDHFFHGETYDARLPLEWIPPTDERTDGSIKSSANRSIITSRTREQTWGPVVEVTPPATSPTSMEVSERRVNIGVAHCRGKRDERDARDARDAINGASESSRPFLIL